MSTATKDVAQVTKDIVTVAKVRYKQYYECVARIRLPALRGLSHIIITKVAIADL